VVLRGKSVAMQADLKKQVKSQTNNITLHLKELGGKKETNLKISRWKKVLDWNRNK